LIDWINIKNIDNDYFLNIPAFKKKQSSTSLLENAYETINQIFNDYNPPFTLFVSGGVDSQAMLYLWKLSGKPFNAVGVKYNNDLNQHDLKTLYEFCTINQIDFQHYNFDIIDFLENEYFEYVEKYRCGSPHICSYMKFSTFINEGTAVYSGNFLSPFHPNFFSKNVFGLYKYAKIENKSLVPFFLCETQNLAYSLEEPYNSKEENYLYNGLPIIRQEKNYTGFEKIKEYYDIRNKYQMTVKDRFNRLRTQTSMRQFDIIFRNKFEKKFEKDVYAIGYSYHE
jgi:hypothetical protein